MLALLLALAMGPAEAGGRASGWAVLSTTGVVAGTIGAVGAGAGLAELSSPEPHGYWAFFPAGTALLTGGTAMACGGSWGRAGRLGVSPRSAQVGTLLLAGGAAVSLTSEALADRTSETLWLVGLWSGTALTTSGLVAAGMQGAGNQQSRFPTYGVVPMLGPHTQGLALVVTR
jgi:hypothetical protein